MMEKKNKKEQGIVSEDKDIYNHVMALKDANNGIYWFEEYLENI